MSDLPRVKGRIVDDELVWTCPECGNENHSGISKVARSYQKRHNLDLDYKKLCMKCPKGTFNYFIVDVD